MDAAIVCIAELGYHGATMDAIVARAGLSRGAQVHHFPTKMDLVEASMDYMLANLIDDLRDHTNRIRDNKELPEDLFRHLWENYFSKSLFFVTMELIVASRSNARLKARTSAISDRFHQSLDDCWYLLCRGGSIDDRRLVLILNLTTTLLRGMGFQSVLWDRPEYFNDLLREWLLITRKYFEPSSRSAVASHQATGDARREPVAPIQCTDTDVPSR